MSENIHDKGYKRILSKRENFLELLKSFVNEKWVERIEENNILLIDKGFIPKDFQEREADIIYKCSLDGNIVFFYILLELQSTVDYTMPFRLLNYMTELMKREFMDAPQKDRERVDYRLPAVLPIVIHNGAHPWTAAPSFSEYQNGFEMFGNHIIDFKYILLNVNSYDDNELFEFKNLISIVFALDKKSDVKRLIRTFERVVKIFSSLNSDAQIDLIDWLRDVLIKKYPRNSKEISQLVQIFEKGDGENMVYAIERLFDEVEEKGMEKGMEIIIERMLKKGKSVEAIAEDTDLPLSRIISLKEYLEKNN